MCLPARFVTGSRVGSIDCGVVAAEVLVQNRYRISYPRENMHWAQYDQEKLRWWLGKGSSEVRYELREPVSVEQHEATTLLQPERFFSVRKRVG